MSRCGKTEQLEAMVMGEVERPRAAELQLHVSRCAVCRHELHWLKSERVMFEQRVAREQVEQLWEGFAARRAAPVVPRRPRWDRWALAAVASALLVFGLSARTERTADQAGASLESSAAMSFEAMSRDLGSSDRRGCSQLQPGTGFACGPFLAASFALRE